MYTHTHTHTHIQSSYLYSREKTVSGNMAELIKTLLSFSEQAGEIARAVRQEPQLFSLLVEEKGEEEKNQRFTHDFKTLADVLIQEALRYCVAQAFPVLSEYVRGEESAEFTNTLGETITVMVCPTQQETAQLLAKVLNDNKEAAEILATLVHSDFSWQPDLEFDKIPSLPIDNLGIWIDPIDSTGEYVKGDMGVTLGNITQRGLPCVTVLIGVYDRTTGLPVGGVINQPFADYNHEKKSWQGKAYWGVSWNGTRIHNLPSAPRMSADESELAVVVSSSEDKKLLGQLTANGFKVIFATGAGYKILAVALGLCAACLSSKGSTFRWDTAAPHALLEAEGGGLVDYKKLYHLYSEQKDVGADALKELQIRYYEPNPPPGQKWNNAGGFVAYQDSSILPRVLACLSQ
ncbi:hypothetical protein Pmani_037413 [Petrolisthes manimaculis]|uniref:inositol-1,4-bisphosphate 1-phosphatase n=1 Tax=Petrolisthes manimaculis TaxID=1843537 RepID=A0AAE1NGU7_9EUCA|nr:hypothetical protein Pmani_037413 [Petrolisthes manimaculis]